MEDERYPIGAFKEMDHPAFEELQSILCQIEKTPSILRDAVKHLSDAELDVSYREGGWTITQIYEDFDREMVSDTFGRMTLSTVVQRFLWHDRHHIAQILSSNNSAVSCEKLFLATD